MSERTQRMTTLAVLTAIAYLVMLILRIRFIPNADFLTLDVKDTVIVVGGFLFGPMATLLMSLVVSLIEMLTVSGTGVIGMVMNVLSSCAFASSAALIYKRRRALPSAIIGLATGCLLATATMLLWNYIITPVYMGVPRPVITGMLIPTFLPFNLIKYGVNAAIAMLIYKPLVTALRHAHLIPESRTLPGSGKISLGVLFAATAVLATLVLVILSYKGVI